PAGAALGDFCCRALSNCGQRRLVHRAVGAARGLPVALGRVRRTGREKGRSFDLRQARHRIFKKSLVVVSALAAAVLTAATLFPASSPAAGAPREAHALWVHPPDVGTTVESVRQFVEKCKRAN